MIQNAVILSTGDEITTGKVVDTNANYLSDKLAEIGIDLVAVLTVGDVPDRLEWAWRTAIEKGDVVISTGGIGPTADDLTTETIARVAGVQAVARRGDRRAHEKIVRVDQPPDAREQSQAGALSRGRDRHPESARHRARLQDAGDARRPHLRI